MAFDGIVTKLVTDEFEQDIIGGKIDKIYQPDKNTIILGIYSLGKHLSLNICIDAHNCRINLSTHSKTNPTIAPNFCMLLRKHLIGGKIFKIIHFGLERLINIEIETINEFNEIELKTLIVELMGRHSNIILIDKNNIIVDSMRHIYANNDNYRDILPNRYYTLPSSDKYDFFKIENFDEFYNLVYTSFHEVENVENTKKSECLSKIISNNFTGFSISFVKSAIKYCSNIFKGNNPIDYFSKEYLSILYKYFTDILTSPNELSFEKIYKNDKVSDYVLIKKSNLKNNEDTKFPLNFFIDDFYFERENLELFTNYKSNILKLMLDLLKKYNNRLANINLKLKDCSEMDKYKLYGELITANLYRLNNVHLDSIELENYYDNNFLITIPLDKKYPPNINAKRYFKKYNKLKNAYDIVSSQKYETNQELNYIESVIYELENTNTLEDVQEIFEEISENIVFKSTLKKKEKNKKSKNNSKNKKKVVSYSPIKYEISGFTILVGKNNKENDWLTLSFANKNDIWFHTKDIQGSHVILKTNNLEVSDDILVSCAQIAAKHSKAKNSSNVSVDYCKVQFVKKPNGAKPGMVTFTNNKTIHVNP